MNLCIFSDFDGTITHGDELDRIISQIYSYDIYKKYENMLLDNSITYEKYLFDLFQGKNILNYINRDSIDPTFQEFYNTIKYPFYIISSGFKNFILEHVPFINPELIFANDISRNGDITLYNGQKSINKREIIEQYKVNNPSAKIVYIGDGISDFSVLDVVDFIYVKRESILHRKLIDMKIPNYKTFSYFSEIDTFLTTY